ncbi:sensor histidine kinase [Parvibacter caecicola]|uniref:sensor histidine kinase n=1 Tax=Parvibacter caecicola TaxID=747645 RepID=UPI0027304F6A|nr:HAMP domain-containing sensor histidine kinase [Parvibacter caecicola]
MALRSDQAKILRRKVVRSAFVRIGVFTLVVALAAVGFTLFLRDSVANFVADNTSRWVSLNSDAQLQHVLRENGLMDTSVALAYADSNLDPLAIPFSGEEYDEELAAIEEMRELGKESASADTSQKADGPTEGAGDVSVFVEGEGENDAEGAPSADNTLLTWEEAQEQQARENYFRAVKNRLHTEDDVLARTVYGCARMAELSESEAATMLEGLYRESQQQALDVWREQDPQQQAQQLSLSLVTPDPVYQVLTDSAGQVQIRDISIYSFIRSLRIPLLLLVLVVGWFVIIWLSLNKSMRYFDDLSEAVAGLLSNRQAKIELPDDLSIVQNELAVIRAQSLADERAAQAAETRKNELVAYLAHDIRTPLTSVLGYLDLLREGRELPRSVQQKYADIAYAKAVRLEDLINEFFEITRYNLSAIPIEREMVNVRFFCQQVAESFFPEAQSRHLEIRVVAGSEMQFFIDPDKLARAIGNIMRNAVAHAEEGTPITLEAVQGEDNATVIAVTNYGREISPEHLKTVFEKFYREDSARSSDSGGTGLGLAITREIVVAHGGTITAASESGRTVFTIVLPYVDRGW